MNTSLQVIKRDHKSVPFTSEKIAIAIKKGFESVYKEVNQSDVNRVFKEVISTIELQYQHRPSIHIEDIQDLIEKTLLRLGYQEVYESFSTYRRLRRDSRSVFLSKQHKFLKALEQISSKEASDNDLKRENANIDGNSSMGLMLQYGSTVAKEYAKAYLLSSKAAAAHDEGRIHIHDMDFLPMGTTTCCQIDLKKLFEHGFSTGHGHLRTPNDITTYGALAAIAIQSNQNDQHGGQSIPAFDYYMADGVIKTFKKEFTNRLHEYQQLLHADESIIALLVTNIQSLTSLDVTSFLEEVKQRYPESYHLVYSAYQKAYEKTEEKTYQTMEAFIHNLNTMHSRAGAQVPFSSINFGTDISLAGRMVIKNYLLALDKGLGKGETPIFPISIFKVKEGVNVLPEDPNADLFELACKVSAKRLFPNFSFLDAPFNLQYYKKDDYNSEVTYMGCRTRVISNIVDSNKEVVTGRGNLSFTSINLPRIALKYGKALQENPSLDGFYQELSETMDLIKDQLLDRFNDQCRKSVVNFPFLLGQGIWMDSDSLKRKDNLKKVLKHGTLSIGFIGLAEALVALIGEHHGQSEQAQTLGLDIISFIRSRVDTYAKETELNFSLIATPAEGLAGRFVSMDQAIFGKILGVTDKSYYTNSFHIPVGYAIPARKKIALESPYHALTNAGHITYVELDGDTSQNITALKQIVLMMKEAGIGYGAINHPVDRDPICGFTGIIHDVCPKCQREEGNVPFERIRRITGYLVGTVDRFNNAKKSEVYDRVVHR